jgi:prepilin-type N-terminal cleavage/methylation domain-containing protein
MNSSKTRGFSLLELMISMVIIMIMAAITAISLGPIMKQQDVNNAYNDVLTTMRRGRDQAASDMRTYVVTFTAPATIVVQQSISASGTCQIPPTGNVIETMNLPSDITFHIEPGVPTSNTTAPMTPDQFGNAANPIDFDQGYTPGYTSICFNPDGSATDANGNINNGVVYFGRPGDLYSSRAITLWGSTSRLRGWRLYNVSGTNTWKQQ